MSKIFLIGLGSRGQIHADIITKYKDNTVIVGGYDENEIVRKTAAVNKIFPIYDNLITGLEQTNPDILVIATPPNVRYTLFKTCSSVQSLKLIIMEKPMALSMDEALAIHELCLEKNWFLLIVHQSKFSEEFIAMKKSLDQKRLGDLLFFKASCYGNIFNQGSHSVDLLRWFVNGERVLWVDATGNDHPSLMSLSQFTDQYSPDDEHPGHLWTNVQMRLESGIDIHLTCGVLDTNPLPELGPWYQRRILAVGTKGVAEAHLAAHFKELSIRDSQPSEYLTSQAQYLDSLSNFYRYALNYQSIARSDRISIMEDHLYTLAVLSAAFASANHHKLIKIPTVIDELRKLDQYHQNPSTQNDQSQSPYLISVIIPMETHRGIGLEAVLSWTAKQSYDAHLFEVIVVFHDYQEGLRKKIEPKLRLHDKAISITAANEIELCHVGATHAKGKYLLFTESHCIAESEAVKQTLNFFKTETYAALYPRTENICPNTIAKMEAKLYEFGLSEYSNSDYWAKLTLHAFAISRELYLSLGGFKYQYNRYAYWMLAAQMHLNDHKIGYAPGVGIKHLFATNFTQFKEFISECAWGESYFRYSEAFLHPHYQLINTPKTWLTVKPKKILITKQIGAGTNQSLWNFNLNSFYFYRNLSIFIYGDTIRKFMIRLYHQIYPAIYRTLFTIFKKHQKLAWHFYYKYYQSVMSWYQIKHFINPSSGFLYTSRQVNVRNNDHYLLSRLDENHLYGFHLIETYQKQTFRWASKISAIKLLLQPNDYILTIAVLKNICEIHPRIETQYYFGKHRITDLHVDDDSLQISLRISKTYFTETTNDYWLIMISKTVPNSASNQDLRKRSLPIEWIFLETISS